MPSRCGPVFRSRYGATANGRCAGERGSVTAEFAVALPAVIVVLAFLLAGAAAGAAQLNLEKAAQAAVRQLGRGETEAAAARTVLSIAGEGAAVAADSSGGWVTVRVTASVPGPWPELGGWTLAAEATGPAELGGGAADPAGAGSGDG
ncbi:TadE family type IV pilus minor pilin [Arthrobacter sp. NPDC055138]